MLTGGSTSDNPRGFDLTHIAAVCDHAFTTLRPHAYPPEIRIVRGMPAVLAPDEAHQLAAVQTLRRVGYGAFSALAIGIGGRSRPGTYGGATEELPYWIRVRGWDIDALRRRLDALTTTGHQLAADLPLNIGRAIDTFAVTLDQPNPSSTASSRLRAQLRDQVTQATGPHVPYDPHILPAHPRLADLLQRVRAQEHRVDDLISRTWLYAAEAIQAYDACDPHIEPALARDRALVDALNHATELAHRDTIIAVLEWARDHDHGDAIAYAHWYANTHGTLANGPDPATAYATWRDHTAAQHPTAIAIHDHPTGGPADIHSDIHNPGNAIDAAGDQAQNQTYVRNVSQAGRRAS